MKTILFVFGDSLEWYRTKKNLEWFINNINIKIYFVSEYSSHKELGNSVHITTSKHIPFGSNKYNNQINLYLDTVKHLSLSYDTFIYVNASDIMLEQLNVNQGDIVVSQSLSNQKNIKSNKILNSIELLSSSYVKDQGKIKKISELNLNIREKLFFTLYQNKVFDILNFKPNFTTKYLFLIPSVIHTSNNPLWTNIRSVFTGEERLKQTLLQLKSIKEYLPDSRSILLESSDLNLDDIDKLVENGADYVVLYIKDKESQDLAHIDKNKNKSEVYVLKECVKKLEDVKFEWVIKFGGRYMLEKSLEHGVLFTDQPTAKIISARDSYNNQGFLISILYSIPKKYFQTYIQILNQMFEILKYTISDVEHLLYKLLTQHGIKINNIDQLNVFGQRALEGTINRL